MKLKYIYISLIISLSLGSCDDFLTMEPDHSLTTENAVRSYADAEHIVNGIYGVYKNSGDLGGGIAGSLHSMAGLWTYNSTMYTMGYTQSGNNSTIGNIWSSFYRIINGANASLESISKLDDNLFPSVERKNELIAEARLFRGYSNLHLLWLFGHWFDEADSPYGILYRDKVSNATNLMIDRSTVGESYQYIIDDLKYAIEHAANYKTGRRLSKQFAKVMYAKLLLNRAWDGDYAESLTIVNSLLAETSGSFKMEKDLSQLYIDGWDSNEVLFSRYLGDNASGYNGMSGSEFMYSYALYYDNEFTDIPQEWLEDDERYPIIFGTARAPETWDDNEKDNVLVKLYHRGRYLGPNDMYAAYIFRYVELYLMKAELLARTNPSNISAALAPINEMRANYTNPVLPPITGITTHQELMDAIFKEYVVTLFMENEPPWFASLRFEHD